jgi:mRNA interferase HigB
MERLSNELASYASRRQAPRLGCGKHLRNRLNRRKEYEAWPDIVTRANWRNPEDVRASYPKASILKGSRVVFNIKANDYRLVAAAQYRAGALAIRFFGSHAEYDGIDAETV